MARSRSLTAILAPAVTAGLLTGVALVPSAAGVASARGVAHVPAAGTLLDALADPAGNGLDYFGNAVAVSGHTAIVGARYALGPVYIYVQGTSGWPGTPTATLPDPVTSGSDGFGYAVSVSGATAAVGAQFTTSGGIVYVYTKGKSGWPTSPSASLPDPSTGTFNGFGDAVAVDGSTIVVGAPQADNGNGIAYVYVKGKAGWPTTPTATVADPGDPGVSVIDNFGSAVAISGRTFLVGAPGTNLFEGAAYVYAKGAGGWPTSPTATLPGPGVSGGQIFQFGWSLSISGTTAVVGSPGTGQGGGMTYVYVKGHGGWSPVPTASLNDPGGKVNDHFGFSVAVAGTTVVAGAWGVDAQYGETYIFAKGGSGWSSTPTVSLPGAIYGHFGRAVAASGSAVVIGAPYGLTYVGAAGIYQG